MCNPDCPVRGNDLEGGRDRLKSTYRHLLQNIKIPLDHCDLQNRRRRANGAKRNQPKPCGCAALGLFGIADYRMSNNSCT
jgi:hypothetical protein